jgi:hypothetical protein
MPVWAIPRAVGEVATQREGRLRSDTVEAVDDVEDVLEFGGHGPVSSLIGISS